MEEITMKQPIGVKGPYPYTSAIRAGDFVFVSGQVPTGPDGVVVAGGIKPQVHAAIGNLGKVLEMAGCSFADVVKVTAFLSDPKDFGTFNEVYATYFQDPPPARSTVCTPLVIDAKIELDAVVYRPLGSGVQS